MKKYYLLTLFVFSILISSCDNEDNTELAKFAVPTLKSLSEIRNSVSVGSARQTNSDGKIYVTNNFFFT